MNLSKYSMPQKYPALNKHCQNKSTGDVPIFHISAKNKCRYYKHKLKKSFLIKLYLFHNISLSLYINNYYFRNFFVSFSLTFLYNSIYLFRCQQLFSNFLLNSKLFLAFLKNVCYTKFVKSLRSDILCITLVIN